MSSMYNNIRHSLSLVEKLINRITGEVIVPRSDLFGGDHQGPLIVLRAAGNRHQYVKVVFLKTGSIEEVSLHAIDLFYDIDSYCAETVDNLQPLEAIENIKKGNKLAGAA